MQKDGGRVGLGLNFGIVVFPYAVYLHSGDVQFSNGKNKRFWYHELIAEV